MSIVGVEPFYNRKGLLQNESFAAGLFLCYGAVLGYLSGARIANWCYLGYSKTDREDSHGLPVEFFVTFIRYATFFSE